MGKMIEWICCFVCGGKARKNDTYRQFYCCRADSNNTKKCTIHTVDMELVGGMILAEIQHTKRAVQDESGLVNRLLAFCCDESKNKKAAQEKACATT